MDFDMIKDQRQTPVFCTLTPLPVAEKGSKAWM